MGLQDHDGTLVFAQLADVRALAPQGAGARACACASRRAHGAAAWRRVRAALPAGFEVSDWTQDNANYFRAIRIEKTMMSLILLLIVAVAAFNIVAMLVMVVTDKRTDIAIVRTFGAAPRSVMGIFITQGLVIGWLGVRSGWRSGCVLALQRRHHRAVPRAHLPLPDHGRGRLLHHRDPLRGALGQRARHRRRGLRLTALATVYPALRAARTAPAEALRYE